MKNRTAGDLYDTLSKDLTWRKRELSDLKLLIEQRNQSSSKSNVLLRSGVALLYAHWEGYIKTAAKSYLEHISSQRLKNRELALHILAVSARPTLNAATGANEISAHLLVAKFFIDQPEEVCNIPYEVAIKTSNLNYKLFQDVTLMLGLDLPLAETTRQLIDERLVKERNKIAHGEYLPIDHDSYNELHREIIKLLDIYSNEITNCAVAKKYLRSIDTK